MTEINPIEQTKKNVATANELLAAAIASLKEVMAAGDIDKVTSAVEAKNKAELALSKAQTELSIAIQTSDSVNITARVREALELAEFDISGIADGQKYGNYIAVYIQVNPMPEVIEEAAMFTRFITVGNKDTTVTTPKSNRASVKYPVSTKDLLVKFGSQVWKDGNTYQQWYEAAGKDGNKQYAVREALIKLDKAEK